MGDVKKINEIAATDDKVRDMSRRQSLQTRNLDLNHVERRRQQRAISEEMICIAICYGYKKRIRGANTFTLTDKTLRGSPYEKYTDALRGLRVVGHSNGYYIRIQTCYWSWDIKNRKRI